MRRAVFFCLFLWATPAHAKPNLLVVISVDQMRADYLEEASVPYSAGLRALYQEGAVWVRASHRHAPTETAPGHASILTGAYPERHGIVGNEWREDGKPVISVADDVFGKGPQRLLVYTLGDAMKAKDPAARVVALSLKDRAAIFLGGKKADAAIWFDKKKSAFTTSAYYGPAPDWLAAFNASKAKELAAAGTDDLASPAADRLLLDLVEEALSRYRLGEGPHTDLLAVSFSATDYVGHRYGPGSPQMKKQLLALDAILGELLGVLKVSLGRNFDMVLTADHGVLPMPESKEGKARRGRRILQSRLEPALETALQVRHPAPKQKWVAALIFPHLYLNRALARSQDLDWSALVKETAYVARGVDGLSRGHAPGDWDEADPYAAAYRRGYFPGRSGDVLLQPRENALIAEGRRDTQHGSPYDYDARVPLVLWGPDFKTGLFGRPAAVTDLAPTLAKVLGVDLPLAPGGRLLAEALAAPDVHGETVPLPQKAGSGLKP